MIIRAAAIFVFGIQLGMHVHKLQYVLASQKSRRS